MPEEFLVEKQLSLFQKIGHDPYLAVLLIDNPPSQYIPKLFLTLDVRFVS